MNDAETAVGPSARSPRSFLQNLIFGILLAGDLKYPSPKQQMSKARMMVSEMSFRHHRKSVNL